MVFSLTSIAAFQRQQALGLALITNAKWIALMQPPCHIGTTIPVNAFVRAPLEKVYSFGDNGLLGSGAFGNVLLGIHNVTQKRVAVKRMLRTDDNMKDIRYEINSLRTLSAHPNIVNLVDHFDDDKYLSLVMEVAEHGDLCSFLETHGPLCEAAVQHIARQLLSGIQACHANQIVHRDIKLENILVTGMDGDMLSVQIADFGIATNAKHPLKRVCGSKIFMAPELSSGKFYGTPVDIWSLGATIYCLHTGVVPKAGSIDDLDFSGMSEAAKDFILDMLQENPNDRATADDLLKHTWLMGQTDLAAFVQKLMTFIVKNHELIALICGGDCVDSATASLNSIANNLLVGDVGVAQYIKLASQLHSTILDLEEDFPMLRDQVAGMA